MSGLRMEFFKCKRRKIWLAPLVMLLAQLAWGIYYFHDISEKGLAEGWADILYTFPQLNAMMTPVIAAVVASRVADIEHKGQTFKLLYTVYPAGRLFHAKFLCAAFYMTAMIAIQTAVIAAFGLFKGFSGPLPVGRIGEYFLSALAVTLTILLIQLVLSLRIQNQMVGMIAGLVGAFLGLFSMFFPRSFHALLVWAYYGLLCNTAMDWDPATRVVHYSFVDYDWRTLLCLCLIFALVYLIGQRSFVRREV